MSRRRGAIITIGDEVLNGSTLDTNSHWLCTQIAGRGALVTTVVTVHDKRRVGILHTHGARLDFYHRRSWPDD